MEVRRRKVKDRIENFDFNTENINEHILPKAVGKIHCYSSYLKIKIYDNNLFV